MMHVQTVSVFYMQFLLNVLSYLPLIFLNSACVMGQ